MAASHLPNWDNMERILAACEKKKELSNWKYSICMQISSLSFNVYHLYTITWFTRPPTVLIFFKHLLNLADKSLFSLRTFMVITGQIKDC